MEDNKKNVQLLEQLNEKADEIKKLLLMQGCFRAEDLPSSCHQVFDVPSQFLPRNEPGSCCHDYRPCSRTGEHRHDYTVLPGEWKDSKVTTPVYACIPVFNEYKHYPPTYEPVLKNLTIGSYRTGELTLTCSGVYKDSQKPKP